MSCIFFRETAQLALLLWQGGSQPCRLRMVVVRVSDSHHPSPGATTTTFAAWWTSPPTSGGASLLRIEQTRSWFWSSWIVARLLVFFRPPDGDPLSPGSKHDHQKP
ncbi:hypothetical protein J3458_019829 [Metarhizium acridum]|uniref:uncharacterized protein n=1 Tax=Metarhizium acridum TaxID=92637 RepID=UPI001C6C9AD9|nr:hypothetical protein J3458_019829 [Metarhizium acridum]